MLKDLLNEFNLEESFDIGLNKFSYKKLSKPKTIQLLKDNFSENKISEFIGYLKSQYSYNYLLNLKDEYLIFLIVKDGYIEPHFINLTKKELSKTLKNSNNSLKVFSFIFNVIIDILKNERLGVVILSPDKNRTKFYQKILKKLFNKYNLEYNIIVINYLQYDDIILEPKNTIMERLRFRK